MWNDIFRIVFTVGSVIFFYCEGYPKLAIFAACVAGWIAAFAVANYDIRKELIERTQQDIALGAEEVALMKELNARACRKD